MQQNNVGAPRLQCSKTDCYSNNRISNLAVITTQYPPPALTFAFNLLVKFLTFLSIASWPDHLQCLSLATAFSFGEKISTKYNRKFTEMTVQTVYKVKITLPSLATRRTQWTDLHEILHRGLSRGRYHLFQILCRSVQGFRICEGVEFCHFPFT